MYTKELLQKIPNNELIENLILDQLTGVLSRETIIKLAESFIKNNIQFSLIIIDLDNFKLINDNYGHQFGDIVLKNISESLIECTENNGYVGRFGGDEFIILKIGSNEYNDIYEFLKKFYGLSSVFNRNLCIGEISPFISATMGCSTFPKDALTYDELFLKADKALYRGKYKGRNCFIIYLDSKHKNIDILQRINYSIDTQMIAITNIFEQNCPISDSLVSALVYVSKYSHIGNVIFVDNNGNEFSNFGTGKNTIGLKSKELDDNLSLEVFISIREIEDTQVNIDSLINYCKNNKIASLLISKVSIYGNDYGYLIFAEKNVERIWQSENKALMLHFAKTYATKLYCETLVNSKESKWKINLY